MKLIPIKVELHSGDKTSGYPICFYWENIRFEITEISDRWYQARATPDSPVADYYKVRTSGKSIFVIKHELKSDQWFVVSRDEVLIPFSSN